jgi:hypothetical protein
MKQFVYFINYLLLMKQILLQSFIPYNFKYEVFFLENNQLIQNRQNVSYKMVRKGNLIKTE